MINADNAIWTEHQDQLGRKATAAALEEVLRTPLLDTPLCVGVLGGWGTGKTSLMKLLKERLERDDGGKSGPPPLVVWFDTWTYARQELSLWRALLLKVIEDLGPEAIRAAADEDLKAKLAGELETLKTSLYRSLTQTVHGGVKFNPGAAVPLVLDAALRIVTAGVSDKLTGDAKNGGLVAQTLALFKGEDARELTKLIERKTHETHVEEVKSLEQFEATFRQILALLDVGPAAFEDGRKPGPPKRRLYVFVDDLDRCLPEDALAAIEAIKLFLNAQGCVFILGMDDKVVHGGIQARYARYFLEGKSSFQPHDYLDKVIQLPFRLPPLDRSQVEGFLTDIEKRDSSLLTSDIRKLVELAIPSNPRTLKRALNVIRVAAIHAGCGQDDGVAANREETARLRRLIARVILMQVVFPDAYAVAAEGSARLAVLFRWAAGERDLDLPEAILSNTRLLELLRGDRMPTREELAIALSLARPFVPVANA